MDLNNLTNNEKEFKAAVEYAGIPTSEEGLKAEFQSIVDESDLTITNTSAFSPFWQLITALITKPVYWLICFLIRTVMPNNYVKTASGSFLNLLAYAYDIEIKEAAKAEGVITFSRDSIGQPLIVPAGTVVRTISINNNIYRMITDADTEFPADAYTVDVPATAESTGAAYNLAKGYYNILVGEINGVTGVTNGDNWLTSPGADEESDEELRLRIRNQFAAVSDWHTDAKYKAMISENTGFRIDRIYIMHDIPRGPGSADAYILFDTYTPSQSYLDEVNEYINDQGNHGHGDDLIVKAIPYSPTDISVTVHFETGKTTAEKESLLTEIENFIRCAFRENTEYDGNVTKTFPYKRFSWAKLDQELMNYFSSIESYEWGQSDIVPELEIPSINQLTVNSN